MLFILLSLDCFMEQAVSKASERIEKQVYLINFTVKNLHLIYEKIADSYSIVPRVTKSPIMMMIKPPIFFSNKRWGFRRLKYGRTIPDARAKSKNEWPSLRV